jgi:8-oxo-dGTP pyrophosphatase MutT (NUDIX family)
VSLADRLGAALQAGHARVVAVLPGDGGFADHVADPVAAAVLIPITNRAVPGVILTQRPDTMRKHAGQVAFPGGRMDADDADAIAAALREAQEEVALPRNAVTIIGTTDVYHTVTGYAVTPVVSVITPDLTLIPNADEVAAIFEVPLAFLLDPANHQSRIVDWNGGTRRYTEIHYEGRRIWGATAAMIVNLSRRLAWSAYGRAA